MTTTPRLLEVPTAPGAWPLMGHLPHLMRDHIGFITHLHQHGDLVRLRLAGQEMTVVCDAELTRQVLVDDRTYDKGGPQYDRLRTIVGNGLASCPASEHRRQRRLVQPAFRPAQIDRYTTVMTQQADQLTRSWHHGQVLDIVPVFLETAFFTLIRSVLGDTMPSGDIRQRLDDFDTLRNSLLRAMLLPAWAERLPTPQQRAFRRATDRLNRFYRKAVAQQRSHRGDSLLLDALLHVSEAEGGFSDAEAADQLATFVGAGTETVALTMAWALHLLTDSPETGHTLHAHTRSQLAGRAATAADLPHLGPVRDLFNESLRRYCPVWLLNRTVTKNANLGGYQLQRGTILALSPQLLHHLPDQHPRPDTFDLQRWTTNAPSRHAFLPFGAGARRCIGDTYAQAEGVIFLATILSRWRFTPLPGRAVKPTRDILQGPRHLRLRVVKAGAS
ncbi:cytochrome P450 [Streptomyces sp. NPDC001205]